MRVERGEVKFSGNEKQDRAHGFKACISTSLALCCLKQAVDGLDETVGLTGLGPGNDSIEMSACPRRLNFEPPGRLNFEPGWRPV